MEPIDIKGVAAKEINATFQVKMNDKIMPKNKLVRHSIITATVSVLNPLRQIISSESILLKTPGALYLLSNHDISL